jgi:hypothetical protein
LSEKSGGGSIITSSGPKSIRPGFSTKSNKQYTKTKKFPVLYTNVNTIQKTIALKIWFLHLTTILPSLPANINMNWNNMLVICHSYKKFQKRKNPKARIKLYPLFNKKT